MPAGRPKKEIDKENFEKLCSLQCNKEEIAFFFDCSEDTIERWCKRVYNANFAEVIKKCQARGKIALRRYQMDLAKKNAAMAIWLGKQYLGQREPYTPRDDDNDNDAVREFIEAVKTRGGE